MLIFRSAFKIFNKYLNITSKILVYCISIMKEFLLLFLFFNSITYSQTLGCTDPFSKNYNPSATINDGSCQYQTFKVKPEYSKHLNDSLKETSGLIFFDNLLWTHNDDYDKRIIRQKSSY